MDWLGLSVIVALFRAHGKENRHTIRTDDCYFNGNTQCGRSCPRVPESAES
ncbi:hypothetical protein GDI2816 [Gluconacetobacter diazotrophicus PA1 5]|uniref:Uncharacterized protein n=1 Tax=Gluconacetobacter diazotrophicus (strain ATCC 49037 / DSM 5601 / CCUG 37298 / CIP 103539 / LMG 7603 / PAl5) TaxID=272568 RepID=A9HQL1_GLUDA|nr:hypothetical protein GDI2816 [Gluconacetobacter diazotrophicus PA1 5]